MAPRSRGPELASSTLLTLFHPRFRCAQVPRPSWLTSCVVKRRLPLKLTPRTFSTTPTPFKKKDKAGKANAVADSPAPDNHAPRNRDTAIDPYDYRALQAGIDKAIARLHDALAKTRHAGRVSADAIEDLRVELASGTGGGGVGGGGSGKKEHAKTTVRLGDVAAVVPKGGRAMHVFCGEAAHVRAVASAIQSAPYSLTPAVDRENALLLAFPVPPATAETRRQAAEEARRVRDRADGEVRAARGEAQKLLNRWDKEKTVGKDEVHKAREGMERVVKGAAEEVKRVYEAALKMLER